MSTKKKSVAVTSDTMLDDYREAYVDALKEKVRILRQRRDELEEQIIDTIRLLEAMGEF